MSDEGTITFFLRSTGKGVYPVYEPGWLDPCDNRSSGTMSPSSERLNQPLPGTPRWIISGAFLGLLGIMLIAGMTALHDLNEMHRGEQEARHDFLVRTQALSGLCLSIQISLPLHSDLRRDRAALRHIERRRKGRRCPRLAQSPQERHRRRLQRVSHRPQPAGTGRPPHHRATLRPPARPGGWHAWLAHR
ncbi:hypothetical protein SBA3_4810012 [Candidatus Sulfopaludibacter sp. SbA3]|nr:hypothetical protein SBA3_4810012 [Candidatus Sulfopaludibacter sp. SbA3]